MRLRIQCQQTCLHRTVGRVLHLLGTQPNAQQIVQGSREPERVTLAGGLRVPEVVGFLAAVVPLVQRAVTVRKAHKPPRAGTTADLPRCVAVGDIVPSPRGVQVPHETAPSPRTASSNVSRGIAIQNGVNDGCADQTASGTVSRQRRSASVTLHNGAGRQLPDQTSDGIAAGNRPSGKARPDTLADERAK